MDRAQQTQPATRISGRYFLKWAARLVGAVVIAIAYIEWKVVTEDYELENGVMGTYRPIVLLLAYYLFWVFTRRIDGSSYQEAEQRSDDSGHLSRVEIASFSLFVCVAIAFGFAAAQFTYVAAIDLSVAVMVAKAISFIAYLAAAGVVLGLLNKVSKA